MTEYLQFVTVCDCLKVFLDYAQVFVAQHFFLVDFHKVYVSLLVINYRPLTIYLRVKAHRLYHTINHLVFLLFRHLFDLCCLP